MNRADVNPVSAIFPFVGDFGKPIMVAIQKIYDPRSGFKK